MLSKKHSKRFALFAGLAGSVIIGSLVWVLAIAKSPQAAPIVLRFNECPVFAGPHEHLVAALAFSPDGKTLATGSSDGGLRFWSTSTGRLESIFADDATRGIHGLAYTPDGAHLAAVGGVLGNEAWLWDVAAQKIVKYFEEPPKDSGETPVFIYKGKPLDFHVRTVVAFSPDGKTLATAPHGDVLLRDVETGSIVITLAHPAHDVKAVAFSADGKSLATAAGDAKVRLWNLPAGDLQATLAGPTQPLVAVAYSPDGKCIAAASSENRTLLGRSPQPTGHLWSWQLPATRAHATALGNVHVHQIAFADSATVLVAAGKEVKSVDLHGDASNMKTIGTHSQDVLAIAISPDRQLMASGGNDRTVDIRETQAGKLVHQLPGLYDGISSIATSSDGKRFATASIDMRFSTRVAGPAAFADRYQAYFSGGDNVARMNPSCIRIWSTSDGRQESMLPLPPCQVTAIALIPRSNQLVVAGWLPNQRGMLSLWDAASGQQLRDFAVQSSEVLSIAVTPDGQNLASGDGQGNLDVWDIATGDKIESQQHDHAIEAVAYSSDGKQLAAADSDQTARIVDVASGKVSRTLHSQSPIESLAFSPDGRWLAAGTLHPGLELWDLRTSAAGRTLKAAGDYFDTMPGFVAFSPDGRFVVCGGHGKEIAIFDVATQKLHRELSGHFHAATAATFLPDGRLVSGGEERTVRLWDMNAGTLAVTWVAMPANPQQNWDDEWIGYSPAGPFVSSSPISRLIGWLSGGNHDAAPDDTTRRRVDSLFEAEAAQPAEN